MKNALHSIRYIVAAGLIMALVLSGCAPAEEEEIGTVKIGWIGAFSGPAAPWFVPGETGMSIWQDEVNAAGGIEVGGKKYLVEIIQYDDEYDPAKSVLGVKKLVLEDGAKVLLMTSGGPIAAVQPFVNEHEILIMCMCAYETGKDRPWLLAVGEGSPYYSALGIQYVADNYPEVKKVAVLGQDEEVNLNHTAWTLAALEANNFDIVYNKPFAVETVDFAPIVSAVLATEPDLISFPAAWPEYRLLLTEQLYLQGYTGMIESSEWEVSDLYALVPEEYLEGAIAYMPSRLDDPGLPAETQEYFDKWLARFGPGAPEDVKRAPQSVDYLYQAGMQIWEQGVKLADSFDSNAIKDALQAQPKIQHLFGESTWWGEEIWGVNNALGYKQMVSEVRGGVVAPQAYYYPDEWLAKGNHAELVLKYLEEFGLMWWQR